MHSICIQIQICWGETCLRFFYSNHLLQRFNVSAGIGSFCMANGFTHTETKRTVRLRQTHKWTISSNCEPPLPQPDLLLVCTIIFLSKLPSIQSPCSPHSHFAPTEIIRGGGYSSTLPSTHYNLSIHTHAAHTHPVTVLVRVIIRQVEFPSMATGYRIV